MWSAARSAATCRHIRWVCGKPCSSTIGLPEPPTATLSATPSSDDTLVVESGDLHGEPFEAGKRTPLPGAAAPASRAAAPTILERESGSVERSAKDLRSELIDLRSTNWNGSLGLTASSHWTGIAGD